MATLVATRCNPVIRRFYEHLLANGKESRFDRLYAQTSGDFELDHPSSPDHGRPFLVLMTFFL